jgi:hypothetical protein
MAMDIDKFLDETKQDKKIDFRGQALTLNELSYGTVARFSKIAKEMEDMDEMDTNRVAMGNLLKAGVEEFQDITDAQIERFPPLMLKELTEHILKFNGLSAEEEKELGKGQKEKG